MVIFFWAYWNWFLKSNFYWILLLNYMDVNDVFRRKIVMARQQKLVEIIFWAKNFCCIIRGHCNFSGFVENNGWTILLDISLSCSNHNKIILKLYFSITCEWISASYSEKLNIENLTCSSQTLTFNFHIYPNTLSILLCSFLARFALGPCTGWIQL